MRTIAASDSYLPGSAAGALIVVGLLGAGLLLAGTRDDPDLHTVLDTGMFLLSSLLTFLLWEIGARAKRPFPLWLAVAFAITALLELVHVGVTLGWSGALAQIAEARGFLRPSTWPPSAHFLPIGIVGAIWMMRRDAKGVLSFGVVMAIIGLALFELFHWLPTYTAPVTLGITRPALILGPILWGVAGLASWHLRNEDRILRPLAVMSSLLLLGQIAMLYSEAPHDMPAMIAHLGRMGGYLLLVLWLMHLASRDMNDRIRAERALSFLNEELEQRVHERTAELEATNDRLEGEIDVRVRAEHKANEQLERLNLLHHITRAIGDRQDLKSIFLVITRNLEDQLPVDFTCICLYDPTGHVLTVTTIGIKSLAGAAVLAMPEGAEIAIDENGLSKCVGGRLIYEPDTAISGFPFPQRLADGGLRSLVLAPLLVESQVFGVVVVARRAPNSFNSGECEFLRQLSEHVALAAHQSQLYGALQRAYDDLRQTQQAVMQQERLRALGQMASGIAHDINNAITPVSLYTESLLETEPDLSTRARGFLEIVQRAVDDVAHTVARMKEFYRQHEPQLELAPVRLNNLIKQVMDLTRARWSDMPMQRGIVIETHIDLSPDLPVVMGVESEIREALINLVFNAVDAMPTGGHLTLRTKSDPPSGADDATPGHVLVEVGDDGAGMDEHTRQRCLEPFFTTKGERGTGLGLAMVYGVARRHGAEIEIESVVGSGTCVSLQFPAPEPASMTVAGNEPATTTPPRMRLLLVDDDPVLLKSLRDTLEIDGHVIVTANDGRSGIETFHAEQARGEPFNAVITDLGMPYVDGGKVASAIKSASPDTPVILLTGWGQRLISDRDIPPHVDYVLGKPPKLREVRETLFLCLRRTRA